MGYYTAVPAMVVVALAATIIALAATSAESFLPAAPVLTASPRGTAARRTGMGGRGGALRMKYVPDGLTPEQWKKMQAKEADRKKKMDLGYVGVKGFKSRSLQAWQEAGSGHLFPVNPKKVKTGEIPQEKTPYMQRGGGAWDDSDLAKKQLKSQEGKKITKKAWSETDKAYAAGGYKKELSPSIFPTDPLQWNASKSPGSGKKGAADAKKKAGKPGSKAAANPAGNKRTGKDAARKKAEDSKLKSQIKSEGKKGLFGLW